MKKQIGLFVVVLLVLAFTTSAYAYKMNSNGGGNSWKDKHGHGSFKFLLDDCDFPKMGDWKSWKDKDFDLTCLPDGCFDGFKPMNGNKDFKFKNGHWNGGSSAVPIPATFWLFASGLAGLVGLRRKFKK